MKTILNTTVALAFVLAAAGCDRSPETRGEVDAATVALAERVAESEADVVVYKSPSCGCCTAWIEHLREAGYTVEAVDLDRYSDLVAAKEAAGVPGDLESCHTATIEGYTIEGHVPAAVIARLLRERPDIKGLSVPGMPIGSPGMEGPNPERYEVVAFTESGDRSVFERIDPTR